MTPMLAKIAFAVMAVGWYLIRLPHQRRSARTAIARSRRGAREWALLGFSTLGLGLTPLVYIVTGFPRAGGYAFQPVNAVLGCLVGAGALWMFRLTHRALGRNWSVSLDIRESHTLVTCGVYRYVRHPMYTAFWLWAVAQALLLPNWVAGLSGLVGFGTLYILRVREEERLLCEEFGDHYRAYMQRTARLLPKLR